MHGRYRTLLKAGKTVTTRAGREVRPDEVCIALTIMLLRLRVTSSPEGGIAGVHRRRPEVAALQNFDQVGL